MSHTSVHGANMFLALHDLVSQHILLIYLYTVPYTVYCILYTVYCILYPQEATYQLPTEGPNVAHVTISATTANFHKRQRKVSWLKGLVHMWSLVYNLVMSYLLLALCVLKSRYFIQY